MSYIKYIRGIVIWRLKTGIIEAEQIVCWYVMA
jgi:hypothetical protein